MAGIRWCGVGTVWKNFNREWQEREKLLGMCVWGGWGCMIMSLHYLEVLTFTTNAHDNLSESFHKRNVQWVPPKADGEECKFGLMRLDPLVRTGSGFRMKPHRCGALFLILNLINKVNKMSCGEKRFFAAVASGAVATCTVLSCGSLVDLMLFRDSAWGAFKSQGSASRASLLSFMTVWLPNTIMVCHKRF